MDIGRTLRLTDGEGTSGRMETGMKGIELPVLSKEEGLSI